MATWNFMYGMMEIADIGSIASGWTLNITGSDCCTNICPEITMSPSTLPDGILGVMYDQTISGNNGVEPYTFALTSGALPDGLSLNPNTGQIVGPATALGTFNFTIEATDANGCSGTQDYSIAVVVPKLPWILQLCQMALSELRMIKLFQVLAEQLLILLQLRTAHCQLD